MVWLCAALTPGAETNIARLYHGAALLSSWGDVIISGKWLGRQGAHHGTRGPARACCICHMHGMHQCRQQPTRTASLPSVTCSAGTTLGRTFNSENKEAFDLTPYSESEFRLQVSPGRRPADAP